VTRPVPGLEVAGLVLLLSFAAGGSALTCDVLLLDFFLGSGAPVLTWEFVFFFGSGAPVLT